MLLRVLLLACALRCAGRATLLVALATPSMSRLHSARIESTRAVAAPVKESMRQLSQSLLCRTA